MPLFISEEKSVFDVWHADVLVNTVNCQGAMGAGLAKAFVERFPSIQRPYEAACGLRMNCDGSHLPSFDRTPKSRLPQCLCEGQFDRTCSIHRMRPGAVQAVRVAPGGAHPSASVILNLPTKILWNDPSSLDVVGRSVSELASGFRRAAARFHTVAMPPPGCGFGGLDWEAEVKPMVMKLLADVPQEVVVCLNRRPRG